jgi:uncharacterized protein YjeT (DUF2065 family)
MFEDLLTAVALVLVLEGLLPCIAPGFWQKTMLEVSKMNPKSIRTFGIVSILAGAIVFQLVH